jgi:hypothetical protein
MNTSLLDGSRITVAGVRLRAEKGYWIADHLEGEKWVFERLPKGWRGWTWDHLTGCGTKPTLRRAIQWIVEYREEIAEKLKVRRAQAPKRDGASKP